MDTLSRAEITRLRSLYTKKGRQAEGTFLVEGVKGVKEAVGASWPIRQLLLTPECQDAFTGLTCRRVVISAGDMERVTGVVTAPGVMAELEIVRPPVDAIRGERPVIACWGINDPGNLGTIIRTADWFGITAIMLSAGSVDPYNDKVVRSSMGSLFHVAVYGTAQFADDLQTLRQRGYAIVAADLGGNGIAWPEQPVCLVLGSESHGLPEEIVNLADSRVTIPGNGKAESLNVAVSAGILLHDLMGR